MQKYKILITRKKVPCSKRCVLLKAVMLTRTEKKTDMNITVRITKCSYLCAQGVDPRTGCPGPHSELSGCRPLMLDSQAVGQLVAGLGPLEPVSETCPS